MLHDLTTVFASKSLCSHHRVLFFYCASLGAGFNLHFCRQCFKALDLCFSVLLSYGAIGKLLRKGRGGGGYFLVIGSWECAAGWDRIFTAGLTEMGLPFYAFSEWGRTSSGI